MQTPHKIPAADFDLTVPIHIFDNSSLDAFGNCNRSYLFRYIRGLSGWKGADPMEFGSASHKFLEGYYSGKSITDALQMFISRAKEESSDIPEFAQQAVDSGKVPEYSMEFGVWLMSKYAEIRPREFDDLEPICIDGDYYIEKGFAVDIDNAGVLVGKFDMLARKRSGDSRIWIVDHKTTKAVLNDRYFNFWSPNNQVTTYLMAARELLGETPAGFILNIIRVKDFKRGKIDDNQQKLFARIEVKKSDAQLDERKKQIAWNMKWINYIRDKGISAFSQRAPSACHSWYGDCPFIPLCMAQTEELTELLIESAYKKDPWSPYELAGEGGVKEIMVGDSLL